MEEIQEQETTYFLCDSEPGLNTAVNDKTMILYRKYKECKTFDEGMELKKQYEISLTEDLEQGRINFSQYRVIYDSLYIGFYRVMYPKLKYNFFKKEKLEKIKKTFFATEYDQYKLKNMDLPKYVIETYLARRKDKRWVKANSFLSV